MSSHPAPSGTAEQGEASIKREMRKAACSYGKLGLLIDDQSDAISWVARELYAAETLPEWWKVVRSIACARHAVDAFREIMRGGTRQTLRGLCIVDRYLPTVCGPSRIPIPWDYDPERGESAADTQFKVLLRKSFEGMGLAGGSEWENGTFRVVWVTSYPYAPRGSGESENRRWRTRSLEQLHQLRREIESRPDLRRLLRFGPEEDTPILDESFSTDCMEREDLAEARWRARSWRPMLLALSANLQSAQGGGGATNVLFTGAGASLAQGPHGAGMPTTRALLRRACQPLLPEPRISAPMGRRDLSSREGPCICGASAPRATAERIRWTENTGVSPIDWLVEHIDSDAELEWQLDEVFSEAKHARPLERKQFQIFHRSFRDALYEFDSGYPYHSWLLARMHWAAIITTNFDGFHERAAAAAARLPWLPDKDRRACLHLGSLAMSDRMSYPEVAARLRGLADAIEAQGRFRFHDDSPSQRASRGSLFKPYGGLYTPEDEPALSEPELKNGAPRIERSLIEAIHGAASGSLVVLGHSMRDPFVQHVIATAGDALGKLQLLWVDPVAFRRTEEAIGNRMDWTQLLTERRKAWDHTSREPAQNGGPRFSGPVPAKAHEFVFDLWRTCGRDRDET